MYSMCMLYCVYIITDFVPDMLLCCHHLTLATLDFLMVVQCASLTHRVLITGWDLMQLPWVKVYAGSGVYIRMYLYMAG